MLNAVRGQACICDGSMHLCVCMYVSDYYSGHRVDSLVRLVALRPRDGGLIPSLGNFSTITMTPNIGFLSWSIPG